MIKILLTYGNDVCGLNRVHQFDKGKFILIAHSDKSYDTSTKLELTYRALTLCGEDLGFTLALVYDF